MVDFEKVFLSLADELSGNQKRLPVNSALGVYYGLSREGNLRLAFLSVAPAPKLESTKLLKVTQGAESEKVYWTCFDLLQHDAQKVFFTFCENLIEAVTGISDEQKALQQLKKRYITWKTMFKRDSGNRVSAEVLQGLFGELYFLKKFMLEKYDAPTAIQAWSGPDARSKDYAIGTEWYEIKTVGANSPHVRISSLAQLSSDYDGHLVVIRAERMADQFDNGESCVHDLFKYILAVLNDETLESLFLSKLSAYGYDISDESYTAKFDVKSMTQYKVSDGFPRITEDDIQRIEICDVSYSLILNALKPYRED